MHFILRLFLMILGGVIGICLMRYCEPLVRLFGKNDWAERHLGSGGSYTMWKLIGILVIVVGILYFALG
jgi:hypothetical protein